VDNPHRLLAVMEPDHDFSAKKDKSFQDKMDKLKSSLTKEELTQIDTQAAKLKKFQSEADTPEAAAMLPKLKLEDIPRKVEIIPTQKSIIENVQTLTHDLFTNGIAYVDLAFDLGHIRKNYTSICRFWEK